MTQAAGQLIGTIDTRTLPSLRWWTIARLLFPRFVEELELGRYVRLLLASGRWSVVRLTPHRDAQGRPSAHVFDVQGFDEGEEDSWTTPR
jgi:hypothetical protein